MSGRSKMPEPTPDPRTAVLGRIYDLLRYVVAATVVILAVWLLSDVLTVVFAAALLAVILHGMSCLLQRYTHLCQRRSKTDPPVTWATG